MTNYVEDRKIQLVDAVGAAIGLVSPDMLRGRDASEGIGFTVSQLAYSENKMFMKERLPLQYEQLIPISTEAGEWADSVIYDVSDMTGRGKRIHGRAFDIPKADVNYGQVSMPVLHGGIGYDYSTDELRKTAYLGRPIDSAKMEAAMYAFRAHLNDVAFVGEAGTGGTITGLYNNANVPQGNAPTGTWSTSTPAQKLADVNQLILNVWTNTAYTDFPTDVVIPATKFSQLAITARSDNSDKTVLQFLRENNIAKTERNIDINFTAAFQLDTAGVGGTARMVAFVKNEDRVVMHVPMPLRFLPPQARALVLEVPGEYKYSGVAFRYPRSAYYMDGI